jgi:hypothetical protein
MTRPAEEIARATLDWLAGLDEGQRARATFPFDDAERFVWAYTPEPPREGLSVRDMRPAQRAAANAILAAGLSARAAGEVAAVMALETVLGELERSARRPGWRRRDAELYWFEVFGDPG